MVDLKLLQIMKYREEFFKIHRRVPEESIEPTTKVLLADFAKYFKEFPTHTRVDIKTFATMFSAWHPKLSKENRAAYAQILRKVHKDTPDADRDAIMRTLLELRLSAVLTKLTMEYEEGEIDNLAGDLDEALTAYRREARIKGLDYVRVDMDEVMTAEENDEGLRWRLDVLNRNMRPLRSGDFGIVAARPDRGKTTFLVSELTYMAAQTDRPIVWLNNESTADRIYQRLWQGALGVDKDELSDLWRRGRLKTEYMAATKGTDTYKIRVFDIHGMDNYQVERIVEQNDPAVVVYDMIDNVKGFGDAARTDLALEGMYSWARELCVKYDHAGIATSQISADGANIQYPADHMLKDSKTGKQGACDFILMIGAVDDPGYQNTRFIGLPKNKLRRDGTSGNPQEPVAYKTNKARYEDILYTEDDNVED